jgi:uncharacterized protein (DUF488 family)
VEQVTSKFEGQKGDSQITTNRVSHGFINRLIAEVRMFATIGYEKASLEDFVSTLLASDIEILVDIRDRAQSRRPGFSKSALSAAVRRVGIDYIHLKALGDPKNGRDAARSGKIKKFNIISSQVLDGADAKQAINTVIELAGDKRICLMCYERDPHVCHRLMVADQVEQLGGYRATHLGVNVNADGKRRVLHTC